MIIAGEFKAVTGAQKIWDFSKEQYSYLCEENDKVGFINIKEIGL